METQQIIFCFLDTVNMAECLGFYNWSGKFSSLWKLIQHFQHYLCPWHKWVTWPKLKFVTALAMWFKSEWHCKKYCAKETVSQKDAWRRVLASFYFSVNVVLNATVYDKQQLGVVYPETTPPPTGAQRYPHPACLSVSAFRGFKCRYSLTDDNI